METTPQLENIPCGPGITQQQKDPEALWLDQDISGEELIELDPLEEEHDLENLADEGLGNKHLVEGLRPYSGRLWEIMWRALKADLQKKYGSTESQVEFQAWLRGGV